ncbi:MAG TPA: NAD-dependent epimerase/dehydratase family protein [Planctomycetota bacterium]|nr:NAD-dependent epimerase/dehydratase family protein [Planctomycetota bacterium]
MNVAVTGGGGFVGRYVVEALIARGHEVGSIGRAPRPELERLGVRAVQADVRDPSGLEAAFRGCAGVVHAAAKTGVWGRRSEFVEANVQGTRSVLEACRRAGVARLVYTSSPSVVFDGRDHVRAGPELAYARRHLCAYSETKAEAEREVLAAHGRGGLATCALRPHLVFGPRDPHLVPRLVERARRGRLAVVGGGENEVTLCYAENAAWAHVLALEALEPGAAHAGRAWFVGQERPVRLWSWIGELCRRLDLPAPRRRVPLGVAYALGAALEGVHSALGLEREPAMTRFVALQLARSHSYDMEPARRAFGYRERVGDAEAMDRLVTWMKAT